MSREIATDGSWWERGLPKIQDHTQEWHQARLDAYKRTTHGRQGYTSEEFDLSLREKAKDAKIDGFPEIAAEFVGLIRGM
jgi:hypothetical protein